MKRLDIVEAIDFSKIDALIFDVDNTIVQWPDSYTMHCLEKICERLSAEGVNITAKDVNENAQCRVLVGDTFDLLTGNRLYVDYRKRIVAIDDHALIIDPREITSMYGDGPLSFSGGHFRTIDNRFMIPEFMIYRYLWLNDMDEALEPLQATAGKNGRIKAKQEQRYDSLRHVVDGLHKDGTIKNPVLDDPDSFLPKADPKLFQFFYNMQDAGKRFFILSNSELEMVTFLLSNMQHDGHSLLEFFPEENISAYNKQKPAVWGNGDGEVPFLSLAKRWGIEPSRSIYFGDCLYTDIIKAKIATKGQMPVAYVERSLEPVARRTVFKTITGDYSLAARKVAMFADMFAGSIGHLAPIDPNGRYENSMALEMGLPRRLPRLATGII